VARCTLHPISADPIGRVQKIPSARVSVAPSPPPTTRSPKVTYDSDSNDNGKIDNWSYMEGTRVLRVEIDKDEDGKIERWEYHGDNQRLEQVGFSRPNDGIVDAWAYQGADGQIARVEVSTARDGVIDGGSITRTDGWCPANTMWTATVVPTSGKRTR